MELGRQTLTKDFGIGTHAGGLFPNGTPGDEPSTSSENSEVVYQFSNWVGSYSASELAKMQSEDPDIGLLVTKTGSRFILVVQDNFKKFVETYAIPNQTAETVTNKLVIEFFSRYGLVLDLHSDQGTNFQSELFRQICCLLEIYQTKTISYRPCSNGMVERFNQTLVNMITTYVNNEQDNWDVYLPIVTSAYRASVHESTGFTPNQLFFGRTVNLPIHFLVGLPAPAKQEFSSYTDYVVYLNDKICKIYELVRENLKTNAKRQKRDYDTRIIFHAYSVGDIVYLLDSSRIVGKSPKLKREVWKGPFVVVRKISDILY